MQTQTAELARRASAPPRMPVEEAADYLGVSISFLNKARLTGHGPVFLKLGSRVAYEIADLDVWLASRRRRSTSSTEAA